MKFGASRQSNFELLRLLSIFFIVFYHLLRWFVQGNPAFDWVRALWLPLHVGVVVFILLSGYFHIRPSSRGLILLLGIVLVYSIPGMVFGIKNAENTHDVLHSLMFISRSEFWFVRIYLGLFLISPLLNTFLDNSSIQLQWYLICVCALICMYFGTFSGNLSDVEGKNLLSFMLFYQIGHLLKEYSSKWKSLKIKPLIVGYCLLNLVIVVSFLFLRGSWSGSLLWKLCFPYNSPILILNAVVLFLIVARLEFSSRLINRLAEHSFSIYLIHSISLIVLFVERPLINGIFQYSGNNVLITILLLFILALILMTGCILIDSIFRPLWKGLDRFGGMIQARIGF